MKILFRVDAGKSAGLGHLMRCIALAEIFEERKVQTFFLIETDDKYLIDNKMVSLKREPGNYKIIPFDIIESLDANLIVETYRKDYSFFVLDRYGFSYEYQQTLRNSGLKWAQFDYSKSGRIIADMVINGNISAQKEDYQELCSIGTALCVGIEYAIVRKIFINQSGNPTERHMLIAMGGGKYPDNILLMIRQLTSHPDYLFHIVSNDLRLRMLVNDRSNVVLYSNSSEINTIYETCEVGIVAGGVTTFELAALNVPMFIIPYAENQKLNATAWDSSGFAISFKNDREFMALIVDIGLKTMINDLQSKFAERKILYDGLGAYRIVDHILNPQKREYVS
jgi:UDP-2,4-diacetamido-2,4,6-trideoxy-beta-L-altropyranose hydrolase